MKEFLVIDLIFTVFVLMLGLVQLLAVSAGMLILALVMGAAEGFGGW